ncbi:YybS family protein [Bacillus sp. ISL-35]|uniref:YybS family protein n=1 Tax=Bacillus sp. ISL-35 TaxID=2819122 RepID=UPI001BE75CA7|nr:YybS family protein [Bacillus sp. ISL-35]MBT2680326.1 YybS family protein [Bacillus sp. ISL-35]MBT2702916.1 YybS family protein [Chryseobacterium sp. ISL-80]
MKNTYKLTEGAILLAIFAVMLLITLYIPGLGMIVNFFLSLPFLMFGAKHDWKSTAVFTLAAVLLSMILGSFLAIPLALAFGTTGAVMGYMVREGKSRFAVYIAGSVVFLVNLVAQYALSIVLFNINFIDEMVTVFRSSVDQAIKMLEQMGQTPDEKLVSQFETMVDMIEVLVPSMFVMSSFLIVFLLQLASFPFMKRFGIKVPVWRPFRELNLPKSILWYYLITMIVALVMQPEQGTYWFWVISNLSFILQMLMVLQGISFVFYFTHIKGYTKAVPIIVIVLMFLLPFILYIVRLLGIIDLGFDLRKRLGEKK